MQIPEELISGSYDELRNGDITYLGLAGLPRTSYDGFLRWVEIVVTPIGRLILIKWRFLDFSDLVVSAQVSNQSLFCSFGNNADELNFSSSLIFLELQPAYAAKLLPSSLP